VPQRRVQAAVYSQLRCTKTVRCICLVGIGTHHCIARCKYGTDFGAERSAVAVALTVDYFRSLQPDGGCFTAAGLLLRTHTAGTLDCGPVAAPAGNVLVCVHKHHTHVYCSVIFTVTAIL